MKAQNRGFRAQFNSRGKGKEVYIMHYNLKKVTGSNKLKKQKKVKDRKTRSRWFMMQNTQV